MRSYCTHMLRGEEEHCVATFKVVDYVSYCTVHMAMVQMTGVEIYMRLTITVVKWNCRYIVHTEYPE